MLKTLKFSVLILSFASLCTLGNTAGATAAPELMPQMSHSGDTPSLAPMIKKVLPSVVNIAVKGKKTVSAPTLQIPDEFRFMFPDLGQLKPREREFKALGSGVIINAKEGLVVTNFHVIDAAEEIKIATIDGREFNAQKVGADQHTDLALLKLEEFSNLSEIHISDSDNLQVGDFAIAIGNPFGLGQTVTSGIISALGRSGLNIENIENFIQTDAAINSGNSGGALINLKGELIGINTAILGPNGGSIGIGFAIPSNMVKTITEQILKFGGVKRGMLGITGTELNADLAQSFGYDQNSGAFVNEVGKHTAADKAGIKSGDIITSVNGKRIKSFAQLRAEIATKRPGSTVKLGIFRDGKELTLDVKLSENKEYAVSSNETSEFSPALEGASLQNEEHGGVVVNDVERGSMAAKLGLKAGDIIVGVNRSKVNNLSDLKELLERARGKISALRINRGNSQLFITLR